MTPNDRDNPDPVSGENTARGASASVRNGVLTAPRVLRSPLFLELAPLASLLICGSIKSFFVSANLDVVHIGSIAVTSSVAGASLPVFFLPLIPRAARFYLLLLLNLALSLLLIVDLVHLKMLGDIVSAASLHNPI